MEKVLIIGSRGFIGRHVLHEFSTKKNIQIFEGYKEKIDLLDIASFKKSLYKIRPDIIINLAAFSHLDKSSYQEVFEINSLSLVKIFDLLINESYEGKFINTSSALVYGSKTPSTIREDLPLMPDHPYAIAKASIDNLISIMKNEIDVITVRPFNCIGQGHRKDYVVPKIIEHFIQKKKIIELGNCESKRDFIDVRDIARMYWTISKTNSDHFAFNLCSGKSTSILQIIRSLEKISNHKIEIKVNKEFFREIDNDNIRGDNSRLKALGFKYRYSLEETLKWMLGR